MRPPQPKSRHQPHQMPLPGNRPVFRQHSPNHSSINHPYQNPQQQPPQLPLPNRPSQQVTKVAINQPTRPDMHRPRPTNYPGPQATDQHQRNRRPHEPLPLCNQQQHPQPDECRRIRQQMPKAPMQPRRQQHAHQPIHIPRTDPILIQPQPGKDQINHLHPPSNHQPPQQQPTPRPLPLPHSPRPTRHRQHLNISLPAHGII